MAQSTNDAFPTAIKLCIILKSRKLKIALKRLSWELEHKAQEFKDVLKMGRTHLQDAVPITLGQGNVCLCFWCKSRFTSH